MTPSLTTIRPIRQHKGLLASMLHRFIETARLNRDAHRLDSLPSDRLADMGMTPKTQANRRNSGKAGQIPPTMLW